MSFITIPLWVLILLCCLATPFVLFLIVYFIAGIHDLIVSDKVAKGTYKSKKECPYYIESPEKKS